MELAIPRGLMFRSNGVDLFPNSALMTLHVSAWLTLKSDVIFAKFGLKSSEIVLTLELLVLIF